jgi:hypothetical protein
LRVGVLLSTPSKPVADRSLQDRGLHPQLGRRTLLESGAAGLLPGLAAESGGLAELIGYLEPHLGHTRYRQRLAEGLSIGSGLVGGRARRPSVSG